MDPEAAEQHTKFTNYKRIFLLLFGLVLTEVDVVSDLFTGISYVKNSTNVLVEGGSLIIFLAISSNFWYVILQA